METVTESKYLYDRLLAYSRAGVTPFHMPGHKRALGSMCDPYAIDITEIEGFDNLHHAEGILKECQERAARLWKSRHTYFLVGGSTAGILAGVSAAAWRPEAEGGVLVMSRVCHKSVYHAAAVCGLETRYTGGLASAEETEEALLELEREGRSACAVVITSPTYEGVVSDVKAIAEVCHRYRVPLIVDEAHGAHFGMHPCFPPSSVSQGADIVIHSVHKTLPALTQTALLHLNSELIQPSQIEFALGVYQTSSPSYVLMASVDNCVRILEESGTELFDLLAANLTEFYGKGEETLRHIRLVRTDDPSKITLCPDRRFLTAAQLERALREGGIEPEMTTRFYVLLISSVADTEESFVKLLKVLQKTDVQAGAWSKESAETAAVPEKSGDSLKASGRTGGAEPGGLYSRPPVRMSIAKALRAKKKDVPLLSRTDEAGEKAGAADADGRRNGRISSDSVGRISAEFLYQYPPGVPMLVPGEEITQELLEAVRQLADEGFSLQGPADHTLETIAVVDGQPVHGGAS